MTRGVGGSTAARELDELKPWPEPAPPIAREERAARLETARRLTRDLGADALLVNAGASLDYFSGVPWSASERLVALLLPVSGLPVMIAPAFEAGSLEAVLQIEASLRLWEEDESPHALVARTLSDLGLGRVALDPLISFGHAERLRAVSVALLDGTAVIDACRSRKSAAELALMRQAKRRTLEVQRRAARMLAPGVRTSEVRRFIDEAHRRLGASGSTFCIVQFGAGTAFPHGLPGDAELKEGDVVLIDTGCAVGGYNSDITRTYVFGQPTAEQARIWAIEKEAQAAAFDAVAPGEPCEAVDAAARAVLERAGLGPGYRLPGLPHRTGHGIGLSVHEAPYLVRGDRTPLARGMCFSNEPMIVVPGRFGVRLEDHFHVTETGAAWFTEPSPSLEAPFG
jgi:Xaa-Pro dipeptidase